MHAKPSGAVLDRLLSPREAAELLGVTEHTLAVWRSSKRYPLPYFCVGRGVRYRPSDLEEFLASRRRGAPTDMPSLRAGRGRSDDAGK